MSGTPCAKFDKAAKPTLWSQVLRHWKLALVAALVLGGVAVYPALGGFVATRMLARRVEAQFGMVLKVERARAGLTRLTFDKVEFAPLGSHLQEDEVVPVRVSIAKMVVPFSAAWGKGRIQLEAPMLEAPSIAALRRMGRKEISQAKSSVGGGARAYPALNFERGSLKIGTAEARGVWAADIQGEVVPNQHAVIKLANVEGDATSLIGASAAGGFGAQALEVRVVLKGLRPQGVPSVLVKNGYVQALPTLGLTGISGQLSPKNTASGAQEVTLAFHGSYGGSRERLWNAQGGLTLATPWQNSEGTLSLRAERFTLDKIADVLPPTVSNPGGTSVAGALNVKLASAVVSVDGTLAITNLGIFHTALASAPVEGLTASLAIDGSYDTSSKVLELKRLEGQLKDLTARVSGSLALTEGTYTFEDGRTWRWLPRIDVALDVPKMPCQKLLSSFPRALIPQLNGFELKGSFEAHLATKIDYADLESLVLDGKVGIDGCKVVAAPAAVADLADPDVPITQIVEVPPNWNEKATDPQEMLFVVGADSSDYVPFNEVSPHLINAFLTTEDGSFFKHKGFATREFRTALKRNLERGRFRQGASSITMQMVKNLLLSHEKTLSRKLQELFLVWYLEQVLGKERIMELYLNVIEFGPRIYGVGPAARHYFGKTAAELSPTEAAFFSSILPSPKRRYVHYCRGALSSSAEKHVKRILNRMHERERLSDDEFATAVAAPLTFDLTERGANEKQCLEWVTRMTATPKAEPEAPEDVE